MLNNFCRKTQEGYLLVIDQEILENNDLAEKNKSLQVDEQFEKVC